MSRNGKSNSSFGAVFGGIKNDFVLFESNLKSDFNSEKFGSELVSFVFDTFLNDANPAIEVLPEKFKIQPLPNLPADNATSVALQRYTLSSKAIAMANDQFREINSSGLSIIKRRVSPAIVESLQSFSSARDAWKYLRTNYGPETRVEADKEAAIWKYFGTKMSPNENFNAFIDTTFTRVRETANPSKEDLQRVLLLSLKDKNPFQIQMLPDRFKKTIEKCRNQNDNLDKVIVALRTAESQFQLENQTRGEPPGKANAVRENRKFDTYCCCYNCANEGHDSYTCKTEICGYCQIFTTDHKWHDCPRRLFKKKGTGYGNRNGDANPPNKKRKRDDYNSGDDESTRSNSSTKSFQKRKGNGKEERGQSPKRGGNNKSGGGKANNKNQGNNKKKRSVNFRESSSGNEFEEEEEGVDRFTYMRRAYSIKKMGRRMTRKITSTTLTDGMKIPMILDSGADEHIVNSTEFLFEQYKRSRMPKIHTASGDEMKVKAIGKIDEDIDEVLVCPAVHDNLLSTVKLQQKGYWVILPPTDHFSEDIESTDAGFVCDKQGRVMLRVDGNMMTDAGCFGCNDDSVQVRLPEIVYNKPYRPIKTTANRVYGLPMDMNTEALVRFVHSVGHFSKADMIFHAEGGIDNYPLTPDQVRKYFPHDCEVCIKGRLRQRKVATNKTPEEVTIEEPVKEEKSSRGILKKPLPQLYDFIKTEKVEPRNLTVGQQVGLDFYGPVLDASVLTATDKASGYSYTLGVRKDGKKDVDKVIQTICDHYQEHGHHSNAWNTPIAEIRADSDTVFVSRKAAEIFQKNGIKSTFSPPHQHEKNGLAECMNQHIANLVTCFYAQARHVPEVLWTAAWAYAVRVRNLKKSNVPGSALTREEEFTQKKPDFDKTPFLPFGTVVEYFIPKASRKSKFSEKAYTGVYLGPSERVENGISVYSFVTRKIVERVTYRVLFRVPDAWTTISPKLFVFSGTKEELFELMDDEEEHEDTTIVRGKDLKTSPSPMLPPAHVPHPLNSTAYTANPSSKPHTTAEIDIPVVVTVDNVPEPNQVAILAQEDQEEIIVQADQQGGSIPPVMPESTNETYSNSDQGGTGKAETEDDPSCQNPTGRPHRSKAQYHKNWKERLQAKRMGKVKRVFCPLVEGAILSGDEDLQNILKKYARECKYTVVKASGRRVQLVDCIAQAKKSSINRMHKYIRKSAKARSKDNPTLEQAQKRPDWPKFEAAIEAELQQMIDEGVYEYIKYKNIGNKMRIIGSMIVLQVKRTPDGKIDKYKARLVALGNQQSRDQYGNIKSPTARSATVKMLMAIQAKIDGYSCVMDVKGAYLKSVIDPDKETLYLRLPNGQYVKLKKYLYGLKQAGYEWNDLLANTLSSNGYTQSQYDPCVFFKNFNNGYIIMATHVDDFYVISTHDTHIQKLHEVLTREFKEVTIKRGDVLGYLGMEVSRKNGTVSIAQPGYTLKILEKSGLNLEKDVVDTPYVEPKQPKPKDVPKVDKNRYLELIGMLNYLAVLTRPDILYALSRCAQRCSDPDEHDLKMVLRIFKYINGTRDSGLTFRSSPDIKLRCWVDASHIHYEDGKGHFGYCFSLGDGDGCFYSRSQKMKIVTPAGSTETEYVALYEATTEIVFLRRLLNEIGFPQDGPTVIFEDNKSTIYMAHGQGDFHKQKHILVKYHYTRQELKNGSVCVKYCETENMLADILTKGTSKHILKRLRPKLLGSIPTGHATALG